MRLLHMGISMNPKKIRRLMRKYNLFCPIRKANPYRRMAKAMKTNNYADNILNRQFEAYGPRMVLLSIRSINRRLADRATLWYNYSNEVYGVG